MEGVRPVSSARWSASAGAAPVGMGHRAARALRVVLAPRNGDVYVDIRIWQEGEDGTWIPTEDGVRFNAGLAPAVAEELVRVASQADKLAEASSQGH